MTTTAKVGAGTVYVMLGGKEYALIPTLAAMQGISRVNGGIRGALDRVVQLDFDTFERVMRLGLGPKTVRQIEQDTGEQLPEILFAAGMTDDTEGKLASKCIEYLSVLSNGGRPIGEARDDTQDPPRS